MSELDGEESPLGTTDISVSFVLKQVCAPETSFTAHSSVSMLSMLKILTFVSEEESYARSNSISDLVNIVMFHELLAPPS